MAKTGDIKNIDGKPHEYVYDGIASRWKPIDQSKLGLGDRGSLPSKFQGTPTVNTNRFGEIPLSQKETARLREREIDEAQRRQRVLAERELIRQDRDKDLSAGRDFFDRIYGSGGGQDSLGKKAFYSDIRDTRSNELRDILSRQKDLTTTTSDIGEALKRRRAALGGLDSVEGQALREQAMRGLLSQQDSARRNLRGSLGNLRGPAAAAAAAQLEQQAGVQQSQLEQDLLLKNYQIQQEALGNFEQAAQAEEARIANRLGQLGQATFQLEQDELARQKFNISQAGRELAARAGSELGFANLGVAERNQILGQLAAEDLAEATEQSGGGGGKKSHFCLEFYRRGLITKEELRKMTNYVGEAMWRRGDFVYWYMKNADKIAEAANRKGFDWSKESDVISRTIDCYENSKQRVHGDVCYIRFCEKMWKRFGRNNVDIDPFEMRFYTPTILDRLVGFTHILFMKKTWSHTPKVLWGRIRRQAWA